MCKIAHLRCVQMFIAALLGMTLICCGPAKPGTDESKEPVIGSGPAKPGADESQETIDASRWPRTAEIEGATVEIHAPQVISWNDFSDLDARLAVLVTPSEGAPFAATLLINADTEADLEERTVQLVSTRVIEASIPGIEEGLATTWLQRLETILPTAPMAVSLEFLLTSLEAMDDGNGNGGQLRDVGALPEVPPIFYSADPAILVVLDGEPVLAPIADSGLRYAINTNWDLLTSGNSWFLRVDDAWLTSEDFKTGWHAARSLPRGFSKLTDKEGWAETLANIPGRSFNPGEAPTVFVSTRPAELIITDGQPALESIKGTSVKWVTNTGSDLFKLDNDWYVLFSGRWFISSDFESSWTELDDVPADFADIPRDHVCAPVLVSVPGTLEAAEALRLAQIPTKATVSREATTNVRYEGEPQFAPIEETTMEYAVNTDSDVIRIGELYYLCFQGVWFVSHFPEGPWEVSDTLPEEITTIPPASPVYHTTYVDVYETTPSTVVYGYTAGYLGLYANHGRLVFGTGWYHPPFIYHPPHMTWWPIYYSYPVTFGVHAHYNPHTGTYARGATAYGPFGGAGRSAAYNPRTGTYARGASAWGPYGGSASVRAYNPRTGAHGWSHQSYNQYQHWGESKVRSGNNWIHSGHYGNDRGAVARFETSNGAKGTVWRGDDGQSGHIVSGPQDNVYAGRDGNVYRRSENGWSRHENGGWTSPNSSIHEKAENRSRAASGAQREVLKSATVGGGIHPNTRSEPRPHPVTSIQGETQTFSRQQTATQHRPENSYNQEYGRRQTRPTEQNQRSSQRQRQPARQSRPPSRQSPNTQQVYRQLERDSQTRNQGAQRTSQSHGARSAGQGRSAGGGGRR